MGFDVHYELLRPDETNSGRMVTFRYQTVVGIRGVQKLVNRWVKCLLTQKGSDILNKTYGTDFPTLIQSNISNMQDAADLVTLYVEDCNAQMRAMDRISKPPLDEQFHSATVVSVSPRGPDGIDAVVVIRNAVNTAAKLPLPVVAALRMP